MKKLTILSITLGLFLLSCTREPEAGFFTSEIKVFVGEEVLFTNNSLNASFFEWNFGDGSVSNVVDPAHIYESTGEFEVSLTAISKDNLVDRAYQIVEVVYPPTLQIEVLEYYDEYPVEGASVILYPSYNDWLNETNFLIEGFTDENGIVIFSNLLEKRYYVDVWEANHDNYTLAEEDVGFIETDILQANSINYFTAWVDYYAPQKSLKERDRTLRGTPKGRSAKDKK